MSNEVVGVYIRLLCYQWENGSINGDPNSHPIKYLNDEWETLKVKFIKGEDGRLRNPRLETIREERISYIEKQRLAGKKGADKRWGSDGKPNGDPISPEMASPSVGQCPNDGSSSPSSSPSLSPSSIASPKKKRKRRAYSAEFERLWAIHPKGGKINALKAMEKLEPDQRELDRWREKLIASKKSIQWTKDGGIFAPDMRRWINGGYFDGEIPTDIPPHESPIDKYEREIGATTKKEANDA